MQAFKSSSSSNFNFTTFSPPHNPNSFFKVSFKTPIVPLVHSPSQTVAAPSCSASKDFTNSVLLENRPLEGEQDSRDNNGDAGDLDSVLTVRRPVMETSSGGPEETNEAEDEPRSSVIDAGLMEFAKKMPMFEPKRVEAEMGSKEKPLVVNLDLALHKASVLARKFQYQEAEVILQKCIYYWPEDGRSYVALGKVLRKQSRFAEARAVYEKGCQATQGENAFIWQCWADLENKMGNIRKARELFDAAIVANKKHVAAWHGWAVLELQQGNIQKARNLLAKGLKYCGGNEYIYQTLARLEARANRHQQAQYLFKEATKCNPNSCASWLAWAQLEMQLENNYTARKLFEKAVQASPKNRFAWHVWGIFEANVGNVEKARKLFRIGHALNPKDPVLLQSLALLEYKYSTANRARVLFRRASELDPKHQPVWIAWGWMEWKEGNLGTARRLYQKALSINSSSESAARCLQAWGVLEQRAGNLLAARRLFRSSLNVNSQSYVTWMTWAQLEEDQGNPIRAEEIRNLYFQQRTEVVDDASWVMGFLDIFDPALDSLKRLFKLDQDGFGAPQDYLRRLAVSAKGSSGMESAEKDSVSGETDFDVDAFIKQRLSLDPSKLEILLETPQNASPKKTKYIRRSR